MSDTLGVIQEALNDAVGNAQEITTDAHLTDDGILDSLDSAVFLLNVETATGKTLSEDDVADKDLFSVKKLIAFLDAK